MEALDGNAIAGQLFDHFGEEMTSASGACTHCLTASQIAELRVYGRPPGTVARCPSCGAVVIVLVEIRGATRVDFGGFKLTGLPSA